MKRVILVVCDGLGRDWLGKGHTPFIDGCLIGRSLPGDRQISYDLLVHNLLDRRHLFRSHFLTVTKIET